MSSGPPKGIFADVVYDSSMPAAQDRMSKWIFQKHTTRPSYQKDHIHHQLFFHNNKQ